MFPSGHITYGRNGCEADLGSRDANAALGWLAILFPLGRCFGATPPDWSYQTGVLLSLDSPRESCTSYLYGPVQANKIGFKGFADCCLFAILVAFLIC